MLRKHEPKRVKLSGQPGNPGWSSTFARMFHADTNSLIHANVREPLAYGTPDVIRYSFEIPTDVEEFLSLLLRMPSYVESVNDVGTHADLIKLGMTLWESVINIKFVEDNHNPQVRIFKFTLHDDLDKYTAIGYAKIKTIHYTTNLQMGLNGEYFSRAEKSQLMSTILHELGHLLGLDHLFETLAKKYSHEELKLSQLLYRNLTSYSIMNYRDETVNASTRIVPVTPMPLDMEAGQRIYGLPSVNHGNTIYHLDNFTFSGDSKNFTIAALPYDSSGIDTLSAAGNPNNVTINLQLYGRSQLSNHIIVTSNMNVENAVCSKGANVVTLNRLNNMVDATSSTQTTIITAANNCGDDIIVGFKPVTDKIILSDVTCATQQTWSLNTIKGNQLEIANRTLKYRGGTQIIFCANHSLTLSDVFPQKLHAVNFIIDSHHDCAVKLSNHSISVVSTALAVRSNDPIDLSLVKSRYPINVSLATNENTCPNNNVVFDAIDEYQPQIDPANSLETTFADFPQEFLSDFGFACLRGMGITFLISLTKDLLERYGCTSKQIAIAMMTAFVITTAASGTYLSSMTGLMMRSLFGYFNFSEESCMTVGIVSSGIVDVIQNNSASVVSVSADMVGNITGCVATLFAYRFARQRIAARTNATPVALANDTVNREVRIDIASLQNH